MIYIILAQICLTIGTPNWVVVLCYVTFGVTVFNAITELREKYKENEAERLLNEMKKRRQAERKQTETV